MPTLPRFSASLEGNTAALKNVHRPGDGRPRGCRAGGDSAPGTGQRSPRPLCPTSWQRRRHFSQRHPTSASGAKGRTRSAKAHGSASRLREGSGTRRRRAGARGAARPRFCGSRGAFTASPIFPAAGRAQSSRSTVCPPSTAGKKTPKLWAFSSELGGTAGVRPTPGQKAFPGVRRAPSGLPTVRSRSVLPTPAPRGRRRPSRGLPRPPERRGSAYRRLGRSARGSSAKAAAAPHARLPDSPLPARSRPAHRTAASDEVPATSLGGHRVRTGRPGAADAAAVHLPPSSLPAQQRLTAADSPRGRSCPLTRRLSPGGPLGTQSAPARRLLLRSPRQRSARSGPAQHSLRKRPERHAPPGDWLRAASIPRRLGGAGLRAARPVPAPTRTLGGESGAREVDPGSSAGRRLVRLWVAIAPAREREGSVVRLTAFVLLLSVSRAPSPRLAGLGVRAPPAALRRPRALPPARKGREAGAAGLGRARGARPLSGARRVPDRFGAS